jgi:hypothetical protein
MGVEVLQRVPASIASVTAARRVGGMVNTHSAAIFPSRAAGRQPEASGDHGVGYISTPVTTPGSTKMDSRLAGLPSAVGVAVITMAPGETL